MRLTARKRTVAVVAAAAILVTAAGLITYRMTGPGIGDPASAEGQASKNRIKPPANGVAEIDGQLYVNGTPTPRPSPSPVPEARSSWDPNFVIPDSIRAEMTPSKGWGASCTPPEPGDACKVPFTGTANLQTKDEGRIVISAFEDRKPLVAAQRVLEPVVKGRNFMCTYRGCPYGGAFLDYSPSVGAKVVTFRVELQDLSGRVLAFVQLDDFYLSP